MRQVLRITDLPGPMKKHTTWQACFDKVMLQCFNIQIVIILSVRIYPARLSKFVPCLLGVQRSLVSLVNDNIAVFGIGLKKPTKLGTEVGGFVYCNVLMTKQFWITDPPTRYFWMGQAGCSAVSYLSSVSIGAGICRPWGVRIRLESSWTTKYEKHYFCNVRKSNTLCAQ